MGLLTNSSPSQGRKKYVKHLINYNRLICFSLFILGIAWFCCLALRDFNNKTYFSENALLPGMYQLNMNCANLLILDLLTGLVYSEIKTDTANLAKSLLDELNREKETYTSKIPYPWVSAKMQQIGLETYTHNFTLNYPLGGGRTFTGKNIYGILRAPRAASTESFVISVPYRPPDSVHTDITAGVPLILAFADYARSEFFYLFKFYCHEIIYMYFFFFEEQKYWSKDIIFLITEQEQLGVHAWLESYHSHDAINVLDYGKLEARAGSIQAAINLEIQGFDVGTLTRL